MTKAELIDKLANKVGINKTQAESFLSSFTELVLNTLREEERFALANFGTFSLSQRKERQGRNPKTGEPITIAACKVVRFHPGKQLREAVDKKPAEGDAPEEAKAEAEEKPAE